VCEAFLKFPFFVAGKNKVSLLIDAVATELSKRNG